MRAIRILFLGAALTVTSTAWGQQNQPPNQNQNPNQQQPGQTQTSGAAGQLVLPGGPGVQPGGPVPTTAAQLPKFGGHWVIAAGERGGQKIPDERIRGLRVNITPDTITLMGRDNKPMFVVGYKLNTALTPNEINMTIVDGPHKGQAAQGIVMMDGIEEMKLCYSPGSQGRPRQFRTQPGGSNDFLFILQRAPFQDEYAGAWRVVAGEVDGQQLPPQRAQAGRVVFTKDTVVVTDPGQPTLVAKYTLNPSRSPNEIDLTIMEGPNKGQVARGIVAQDGPNQMRLCYAFGGEARPAQFHTVPGAPLDVLLVLQRDNGGGNAPNAANGALIIGGEKQTQNGQPGVLQLGPGQNQNPNQPNQGQPNQPNQPNNPGQKPPGGR
jgi:uncharacterized protein (TIGR03067 family)